MKRSLAKGMSNFEAIPITTQLNHDVRPRSAAVGYELSPVELDAVHGGAANLAANGGNTSPVAVCFPHACGGDPNTGPVLPHMSTFARSFKQLANSLNQ
jgi:hypothetical protein